MKRRDLLSLIIFAIVLSNFSMVKIGLKVGDTAGDFTLKNIDGNMISLTDYSNSKGVILVFTCNTCPFSKKYEKRIIDLHNYFSPKGFPVIAINPNDPERSPGDSYHKMVALAHKNNYPFAYLQDETQAITKFYGATNTPHVYVLVKAGKGFKVAYIGAIDNNVQSASHATKKYVEDAVRSILAKKEISTTKTKAIGCTIKWR